MNTLFWVSLAGFVLAVAGMLALWAYDARKRRAGEPEPLPLVIETDRPLTAVDVAAIHHLLTHFMGDAEAKALMPAVYAAVAEHAAKDVDDDLRDLDGAA